jgi:AcrR family transcriptional regulator
MEAATVEANRQPVGQAPASFRDWLEERQDRAEPRRKGEKTRDRVRLATVELLNEAGYRDLKVSDICQRAGVTPPVLYSYFDSKQSLVRGLLVEFLSDYTERAGGGSSPTPYGAMYDANLHWIRCARCNPGLTRCLLQFSDEQSDFADLFADESSRWYLRITQSILRRFPKAVVEEAQIRLVVHALGGMMDEITRRLFADRDGRLVELVDEAAPTDEALAALLTTIWHRALYAADPDPGEAPVLAPKLARAASGARRRRPSATGPTTPA